MATYYEIGFPEKEGWPVSRTMAHYEFQLLDCVSTLHGAVTGTADHDFRTCLEMVQFLRARLKYWEPNNIERVKFTEEFIRLLCREAMMVWCHHHKIFLEHLPMPVIGA